MATGLAALGERFPMTDFCYAGAFVVQFRTSTDFERGRVAGRVEHVASGRVAHFTSMEELLDAFARLARPAPMDAHYEGEMS